MRAFFLEWCLRDLFMKNLMFEIPKLLEINIFKDERGYFFESFNQNIKEYFDKEFVQENISCSKKNVFRGLHYQYDPPMGKLVQCINGEIVDFCFNLKTEECLYFLLDKPNKLLYIPHDWAHGFLSLKDDSVIKYECTSYYNKLGESGVSYNKILDKIEKFVPKEKLIISERDKNL